MHIGQLIHTTEESGGTVQVKDHGPLWIIERVLNTGDWVQAKSLATGTRTLWHIGQFEEAEPCQPLP